MQLKHLMSIFPLGWAFLHWNGFQHGAYDAVVSCFFFLFVMSCFCLDAPWHEWHLEFCDNQSEIPSGWMSMCPRLHSLAMHDACWYATMRVGGRELWQREAEEKAPAHRSQRDWNLFWRIGWKIWYRHGMAWARLLWSTILFWHVLRHDHTDNINITHDHGLGFSLLYIYILFFF